MNQGLQLFFTLQPLFLEVFKKKYIRASKLLTITRKSKLLFLV